MKIEADSGKTEDMHDQLVVINPGVHNALAILFDVCRTKYFFSENACLLVNLAETLYIVVIADVTHMGKGQ